MPKYTRHARRGNARAVRDEPSAAPKRGRLPKRWIRVEADAPTDPRIGALADRLELETAHALGLVVGVWCAMTSQRSTARLPQ